MFLALEDETGMVNVTLWPDDLGSGFAASSGATRCCSSRASSSARARWSTWSPTRSGHWPRPRPRSADRTGPPASGTWATPACAGLRNASDNSAVAAGRPGGRWSTALLAHAPSGALAPVLGSAFAGPPIRDERSVGVPHAAAISGGRWLFGSCRAFGCGRRGGLTVLRRGGRGSGSTGTGSGGTRPRSTRRTPRRSATSGTPR